MVRDSRLVMFAVLCGNLAVRQRVSVDARRSRVLENADRTRIHARAAQISPYAFSGAADDHVDELRIEKVGADRRLTSTDDHGGIGPERLARAGDAVHDGNFSEPVSSESDDVRHIAAFREALATARLQSQVHELDLIPLFLGDGGEDLQHEWLVDAEKHHVVQLRKQQQNAARHACATATRAPEGLSNQACFEGRYGERRPEAGGKLTSAGIFPMALELNFVVTLCPFCRSGHALEGVSRRGVRTWCVSRATYWIISKGNHRPPI